MKLEIAPLPKRSDYNVFTDEPAQTNLPYDIRELLGHLKWLHKIRLKFSDGQYTTDEWKHEESRVLSQILKKADFPSNKYMLHSKGNPPFSASEYTATIGTEEEYTRAFLLCSIENSWDQVFSTNAEIQEKARQKFADLQALILKIRELRRKRNLHLIVWQKNSTSNFTQIVPKTTINLNRKRVELAVFRSYHRGAYYLPAALLTDLNTGERTILTISRFYAGYSFYSGKQALRQVIDNACINC